MGPRFHRAIHRAIRIVMLGLMLTRGTGYAQEANPVALEAVRRLKGQDLSGNPALRTAVGKVVDQVRGEPAMVELIRDFDLRERTADLLEFIQKKPGEEAATEAVRYLAKVDSASVLRLLGGASLEVAVVECVARTGLTEWNPGLEVLVVSGKDQSESIQRAAMRGLLMSEGGAERLVELLKGTRVTDGLRREGIAGLLKVRWPGVVESARRLNPGGGEVTRAGLPSKSRILEVQGDVARGQRVFRRPDLACLTCHVVGREGSDFGPNLTEIGAKLGRDALYDAIVEPSAGISFGFEAWLLDLADGEQVLGLIASETESEITVKTQGGHSTRYRKVDVLKRERQVQSIMPEGLQESLSVQDFADLLFYLGTLKPASR
jgi:putative heme-binding domain-containing protein